MRRPHLCLLWNRHIGDSERGAVATIVAVLIAGGVAMAMLAVSVDLGNLTYERRQVQNGADATSLALAVECAADAANCTPDQVEDLLGANSHDALGQYGSRMDAPNGVCARGTAEQVGALASVKCASATGGAGIGDLKSCPPIPDWLAAGTGIPYVETYAATETTNGDGSKLFLPFSRALAGGDPSGDKGTSACARAAWGHPGSTGPTLPITIGACEWANTTADGGAAGENYAPSPPYSTEGNASTPPPVPAEIAAGDYATGIFTHDSGDHKCSGSPGLEYPGGFGWLANSDCVINVGIGGWTTGATGSSDACTASEFEKYVGTEVFIPIHDDSRGTGSGGEFHIVGVASFYLAGWHAMSPAGTDEIYQEPSGVCTGKCNNSVSYIWGWFTSGQLPAGSIDPDADDFGVTVIKPAG